MRVVDPHALHERILYEQIRARLRVEPLESQRYLFPLLVEVDLAMVPNWMDSPRGEGRLMMAWASMYLLIDDPVQKPSQVVWSRMNCASPGVSTTCPPDSSMWRHMAPCHRSWRTASSAAEADFTAVATITGLQPDTSYHYAVQIDGGDWNYSDRQQFHTFVPSGGSSRFRVAFGGGAGLALGLAFPLTMASRAACLAATRS